VSTMLVILFAAMLKGPFVADASAETHFLIMRPESVVRATLNDIYVLQRNMPGVVAIVPIGEHTWLYKTERRMPFSEVIKTDFVLMRGDGTAVTYSTPDVAAANWMLFRFETAPAGADQTTLRVRVRVRLVRENGGDIHLFAPVLGEDFISDRMHEDLTGMLKRFVANVIRELEASQSDIARDGDLR
jgi:hypothetical protein